MHWSHSYGTGMWIGMVGGTLLGWILLVGLGYLVIRVLLDAPTTPRNDTAGSAPRSLRSALADARLRSSLAAASADPVVLLDQRLARGEIDIEDYRRRRALLSQRPVAQPAEPDEPGHG